MCGAAVDRKSIKTVDLFLLVFVHLRSYYCAGKTEWSISLSFWALLQCQSSIYGPVYTCVGKNMVGISWIGLL